MAKGATEEQQAKEIPIRENLFTQDAGGKPRLILTRCRSCAGTFYPVVPMCPSCIQEGTTERLEVDGSGRLVAFTTVMRGLPGYDSPYALACVDLNSGPSVISQLEDWQGQLLRLGMPVELVIGRIKREKNGSVVVGPKFRPLSAD